MKFDPRSFTCGVLIAIGVGVLAFMALGGHGAMSMQMEASTSTGVLPAGTFDSKHVGLHFDYPAGYAQALNHINEGQEDEYHQVVFVKGQQLAQTDAVWEGPPAITIAGIDVPADTNLEYWVMHDKRSNWSMAYPAYAEGDFDKTTVGGEPALSFNYEGQYTAKAVVVLHKGRMYVFAVSWVAQEDQIRQDFENIIHTVKFIDEAN
ncbi:MAG TPA: hypothetical protein VGP13_01395 [Candidatus Paceibacterota bacterium]|jgi:hypothetical protein|nr:hypothetical protein [Candidatus Paceibacterota bacterium]